LETGGILRPGNPSADANEEASWLGVWALVALVIFLIARFTLKPFRSHRTQRRLSQTEDWSAWTIAPVTREPSRQQEKDAGSA
jgi:flagellar biosynthesis/type III secretory pathway M-ring protein FliF/YscJ